MHCDEVRGTSEGKNGEKEKICDCIAKVIIIKVNFSTNRNCLAVAAVVAVLFSTFTYVNFVYAFILPFDSHHGDAIGRSWLVASA